MVNQFRTHIVEITKYRDVLVQLVRQQLILRYRRTALGYLWTLVNPLLMMSVMVIVFSTLFKVEMKTFAVFLLAGMIPWNFINAVTSQSAVAFIHNEGLIKKIYLPKLIFPLSIALALFIDSMLSFFALFAIILLIGGSLSWTLLFIPIAYVILFFFALGIGLITSVATVFFRDLQYVITIAMQGLFYLTPILYKKTALAGKITWIVDLNPVVPFIELFRAPLYGGALPEHSVIIQAVLISFFAMLIGFSIFAWQEKKIVYRL